MTGSLFVQMLRNAAANLEAHCQEVNDLNVFPVPDGDTGLNMLMTIRGGLQAVQEDLGKTAASAAHGMLMSARGNSGVILSQLFKGIALGLENCPQADAAHMAEALCQGTQQAYRAVVNPVEGTILTVCREAGEYAKSRLHADSTLEELLRDYIVELHTSLLRTPELLPVLKQAGVVDSGAKGLIYIMEGMALVLDGKIMDYVEEHTAQDISAAKPTFNADSVLEFGYCTEFILQLQTSKTDVKHFDLAPVIAYLSTVGDSLVVLQDESLVKVHIHTMTPAAVVGYCQQFGEFISFKMENMSVQHHAMLAKQEPAPQEKKPLAVVAVAAGNGFRQQFTEMGADYIVSGGQTMNPSTEDFIHAFQSICAEHILVLPNNSNIILAAKQAAASYDKADVRVLETKSLAQGYAALSMLDFGAGAYEDIVAVMEQAARHAVSCSVTQAIRDSEYEKITIHKDDCIGICNGKIVAAHPDRLTAIRQMIDSVANFSELEVATIFCGADTDMQEAQAVAELLQQLNPYLEAGILDGGQDVYSYIIALE